MFYIEGLLRMSLYSCKTFGCGIKKIKNGAVQLHEPSLNMKMPHPNF